MSRKSQFQNLVLQQRLEDCAQESTTIQPVITLPIRPETLVPFPPATPLFSQPLLVTPPGEMDEASIPAYDASEEIDPSAPSAVLLPPFLPSSRSRRRKQILRGAALLLGLLLLLAIYLTWHASTPTATAPTITQANVSSFATASDLQPTSGTTAAVSNEGGMIQVYVVGAVKRPGVYTLPADARVYQLIQAAGGPQPDANLISIDLAAKLADGQEIYVLAVGETPPAYTSSPASSGSTGSTPTTSTGPLVNINTATETQMMQGLHVSATTAKKIIAYRTQHGAYTSVDQLAQVVSNSIYNRIKSLVTV